MTNELDERGLVAACRATGAPLPLIEHAIKTYLAATRAEPEGEMDRIAVVMGSDKAVAGSRVNPDRIDWGKLEAHAVALGVEGPFARVVVECRLPRPAEPVVVMGRVTK